MDVHSAGGLVGGLPHPPGLGQVLAGMAHTLLLGSSCWSRYWKCNGGWQGMALAGCLYNHRRKEEICIENYHGRTVFVCNIVFEDSNKDTRINNTVLQFYVGNMSVTV